jgi:hypothetical protein
MSEEIPVNLVKEEREALARIARTHDGLLFYRYLRRVLEGVIITTIDGALRDHNGRRTLARDLMAIMAEGIEQNRVRTEADRSLLTASTGGKPVARSRGTGRRVALEPGDGWHPKREPDGSGET